MYTLPTPSLRKCQSSIDLRGSAAGKNMAKNWAQKNISPNENTLAMNIIGSSGFEHEDDIADGKSPRCTSTNAAVRRTIFIFGLLYFRSKAD